MSVADPWKPFREVMQAPWDHVATWKQQSGRKVMGHLLPDVPEEILHAAGLLPVAIEGGGVQASHAQALIPSYTCNHAMGAMEMALRGDLSVLDGMVIPYVCDTTRNLFHIWNTKFPNMANEFLRMPKRLDYPGVRAYLSAEFSRLYESMAKVSGKAAGSRELGESVLLYNRSRARLREAYDLHRTNSSVWTADKVQLLIGSSLRAPREEHLKWMDVLPWDEKGATPSVDRIPVYVRGKVWDPPQILDLFDQLGLMIVRDEIVTGWRSIAQDAPLNGDPIAALVERHMATIPYTGYYESPDRMVARFVDRVRSSGANGVVFLNPKFCEAAAFDTPDFQKGLEQAQIPSLILETSTRGVSMGQLQVRLEAFREMIGQDLP
jgi:bcr-type benzoyl-CoA reductase subunit C